MTREKFNTSRIHSGYKPEQHNYSATVPIYENTAFYLGSVKRGEKVVSGSLKNSYSYSRVANPTVSVFEKRINHLDRGAETVALGSGMAAITYTILNVAEGGGRVIAPYDLYGASLDEFKTLFPKYNINFDFVKDVNDFTQISQLVKKDTKAIFVESVSNPTTKIAEIKNLAKLAHKYKIPLIVDNTFCTPYLFNPIQLGADIVIYSSTKGISGHGNAISGLVVDAGNFNWDNPKFPQFKENEFILKSPQHPDHYSFVDVFGRLAFIKRIRMKFLRLMGAVLGPFEAYLSIEGLETISERLDREINSTIKIAKFLANNSHVKHVYYSGLPDSKQFNLVKKYFPHGVGSIFSFELKGGYENVKKLINAVKIFTYLPNVGDNRSLIVNPIRTTHRETPIEARKPDHLSDNLIRLSIGLEDSSDLVSDLASAITEAFK